MEKKKNVLLVDNDKPITEMLKIRLENMNFNIVEAGDGLAAISEIRKNIFSLVILDLDMPGLNGMDVLRIIKSDSKLESVKVIILSGVLDEDIKKTAFELGCSAFISKPFRASQIIEKINEILK
ncbi:response regulator [Candidatus Dependentiae bacterium]|nr:response regulator [Candidatus Dependentiae bacterium]